MGKIITAIFGAGVFGSLISLRTYIGIALVLSVSTCTFKADIVDYVKQSSKQSHDERIAQINFETEKMRIEVAEKAKIEAEDKAREEKLFQERLKKEQEQTRQAQIRRQQEQEKEKQAQVEKERIANINRLAHESVCKELFTRYKNQMICAATPNAQGCAPGYTPTQWSMGAGASRREAINNGCAVTY